VPDLDPHRHWIRSVDRWPDAFPQHTVDPSFDQGPIIVHGATLPDCVVLITRPRRYRVPVVARKFTGFGEHAVDFYDGLVADNSKAYWTDNREVYESDVRAPMQALLDDLVPEFGEFGSAKIFRPYRDVRFAKDKTPYKTHCGAVIESGRGAGAYYLQVGPEGLRVAGGSFHTSPDQLRRLRASVADERRGTALAKILATLQAGLGNPRGTAENGAARLRRRPSSDRPAAAQVGVRGCDLRTGRRAARAGNRRSAADPVASGACPERVGGRPHWRGGGAYPSVADRGTCLNRA
jgi:uncharacterized protein (TIGR02453 family)